MSNDELIKTLYHALPGSWMTNLVMQGFNYAHHSLATFLEICERFESLESAKDKHTEFKSSRKRKKITFSDDNSSSSRKYCLIHGLCTHDSNDCTDLK